ASESVAYPSVHLCQYTQPCVAFTEVDCPALDDQVQFLYELPERNRPVTLCGFPDLYPEPQDTFVRYPDFAVSHDRMTQEFDFITSADSALLQVHFQLELLFDIGGHGFQHSVCRSFTPHKDITVVR